MSKLPLRIDQIHALLPHRYPMLLIDRVLEISEGDELVVVAEKLVSVNEPFFQGHFPERPVMPGVLIVEAMAQAAGLGVRYRYPETRTAAVALVGVDKARFRRPVVPGDTLTIRARMKRRRGGLVMFDGVAQVLGETVAEAQVMAQLLDWEPTD